MNSTRRLGAVFAHMSGFGSITSHPNGQHIWTSGADGAIRCYNTELVLLTSFEQQHEGPVRMISMATRGDSLASCGDDQQVKLYSLNASGARPQLKFDSKVLTTSGTAHFVSLRAGGNDLAAGGANKELKLINLIDNTRVITITGHSSTVKWAQYDSAGERLASLDASGTLMVHAIPYVAGKPLFSANIMQSIKPDSPICAAWSNNGELLALPGKSDISIRTTESNFTDVACTLRADNNSKPVSLLAFSPNDVYIAGLIGEDCVMIWDVEKREPVSSIRIEAAVQSFVWCKRENSIVMYDTEGYLRKWDKAVPSHFAKSYDSSSSDDMQFDAVDTDELDPIGDAEDDEEMVETHSTAKSSDDTDSKPRKRLRKALEPSQTRASPSFDDDFDDDDDMADFIEDDTAGLYKADRVDDFLERSERKRLQSAQSAQPAFQSSSTPLDLAHKRRFLCWNLIGSVTSTSQGNFHGIEISFADSNKHKPIKLKDHYGLHIAALVEHGCIMASPYHDAKRPSVVTFKLFDSWAENSDWIMHLAAPESAVCVAAGRRFVAVASDRQFVRILGISGIQLHTMLIQGPIVTMAASDDLLAIVYQHASGALNEHQSLMCLLLDMKTQEEVTSKPLSLSPGARLTWLSFNDTGLLLSMDSAGLLCGLTRRFGWSWSPLLDTNAVPGKGKSDTYWPVGLIESQLMCALCRGTKYPSALSKPILQALKLSLALVPTDTAAMEEQWGRDSVLVSAAAVHRPSKTLTYKEQAALDKTLLMLVQHACTNNNNARALELCTEMKLMKSLEFALLVAKNARKTALAGRIGLLVAVKKRELEVEKSKSAAATTETPAITSGAKMSINRFMNEGEVKAAEANKRRKLAAAEDSNSNMPTVHIHRKGNDTVIDVEDEGETELSYNENGVHQTATVDASSVVEAVKAKLDLEKQEEAERRKRAEAHKKSLAEGVVELDEDTSFGDASDFMSKFNTTQKPATAAAAPEKEKKVAPTKKATPSASSKPVPAKPTSSSPSPPPASSGPPRLNPFAVKVQ